MAKKWRVYALAVHPETHRVITFALMSEHWFKRSAKRKADRYRQYRNPNSPVVHIEYWVLRTVFVKAPKATP